MISMVKKGEIYFFSAELLKKDGTVAFTHHGHIDVAEGMSTKSFIEDVQAGTEEEMIKVMVESGADYEVVFRMLSLNKIGSQS